MTIVTREWLDQQRCADPNCDKEHEALILRSRCHPSVPTWAGYDNGVVTIFCAKCRKNVVSVAVKEGAEDEQVRH